MESNYSEPIDDESKATRPKMQTDGSSSTSPKPKAMDPFQSLPDDIVEKIIANIPVVQWPTLELLDKRFRAITLVAWRQLRRLNLDREFEISKIGNGKDRAAFDESVESILRKLVEHSPLLSSLSGINIPVIGGGLGSSGVIATLLAQFEHLQSITVGDVLPCHRYEISLADVIEFLESTRSRTSLKELRLMNVQPSLRRFPQSTIHHDQFASSFVNGREIRSPFKLEKFFFSSDWRLPFLRLDTMDATRLTELRVGKASVEPHQLTDLIERASNLYGIELSFVHCLVCEGRRLDANKKLLIALSSHQNLTTIKFDCHARTRETRCVNVGDEFIEMLKAIGRRGRLTKLSLEDYFIDADCLRMDKVCATIRRHIPDLRSIKLCDDGSLNDEIVSDIADMMELEEINFADFSPPSASVMMKIARLPRLKRLAIHAFTDHPTNSFEDLDHLIHATKLTDLRIGSARFISANVYEQWAEVFAPNLEVLMLDGIAENDKHAEEGLARVLEEAVRLRVLSLQGHVTNQSLVAVATSCQKLEIFGLRSSSDVITVPRLQEIVDRCPRLKKLGLGGMKKWIRSRLHFPNTRQIGDVDVRFLEVDFDDDEYD